MLTAPTLEEAVHEALILLFRNRPALAAEIVRDVLHVDLPRFKEARVGSADLTTTRPAEYRADLVIELLDGGPVGAIVLEAQQVEDENKRRWWPSHAMVLRYRIERNVCLLVVTQEESVARWASRPIDLGGGNRFTPLVVGPAAMPKITDSAAAKHNPGLAVLSAMVHGRDEDAVRAASIAAAALGASATLDPERARQYRDLVLASLGEAARRNVQLKAD